MEAFGCPAVLAFEDALFEGELVEGEEALFVGHFDEVSGEAGAQAVDAGTEEEVGGAVYGEDVEVRLVPSGGLLFMIISSGFVMD